MHSNLQHKHAFYLGDGEKLNKLILKVHENNRLILAKTFLKKKNMGNFST